MNEINEIKKLCKEIDQKIQEVKNLPPSRERSICITKLQEAVMWLGMDLKRLNDTNPYPSRVETETPPPPAADYENDKLMVVYEEIDRMEIAEREQQKREHPNWRSVQKKGNGVRFLNIAKANDIETVGQLLKVGRVHFEQLRNMGPYCAAKVSEALKNLYGIETW